MWPGGARRLASVTDADCTSATGSTLVRSSNRCSICRGSHLSASTLPTVCGSTRRRFGRATSVLWERSDQRSGHVRGMRSRRRLPRTSKCSSFTTTCSAVGYPIDGGSRSARLAWSKPPGRARSSCSAVTTTKTRLSSVNVAGRRFVVSTANTLSDRVRGRPTLVAQCGGDNHRHNRGGRLGVVDGGTGLSPGHCGVLSALSLLAQLRGLGLEQVDTLLLTRNRRTMVSIRGRVLRVHEALPSRPTPVHQAVVDFVMARRRGPRRAAALAAIVEFARTIQADGPPSRLPRTHADDVAWADRLAEHHDGYNLDRFGGTLTRIPIRVSRRMQSRLGHYAPIA